MASARQAVRFARINGRLERALFVAGVLFFGVSAMGRAEAPSPANPEYAVKAAALYNVVPFVEWPETAFASPHAALVIGVLGQNPFGQMMEHLIANETFRGRQIIVERYASAERIGQCHLLFVARSEQRNWPKIQQAIAQRSVLTVSDAENFAARGGSVQFTVVNNKLRIVVNVKATQQAGLTVSSKLLRLAEVVGEDRR